MLERGLSQARRVSLLAVALILLFPLLTPGRALAQWPGDDRLNPHPAEYYTVYCKNDSVTVYRGNGRLLNTIPITTILSLASGGSTGVGAGMTASRSGDTVTISGTGGNYTGSGSKSFSLTTCVERNGPVLAYYTPAQAGTYPGIYPAPAASTTTTTPITTGTCAYIVQPGDTLNGIALAYRIALGQLAAANGLNPYGWLYAGQRLILPSCGSALPVTVPVTTIPVVTTTGARIHIVQPGENLFRIGLAYGVHFTRIAAANGIVNPSQIYAGQRLIIPG